MIITGVDGNPIVTVSQQLDIPLTVIEGDCPIFLPDGITSVALDDKAQKEFDGALDAAVALGDRLSATRRLRPHLSLGSLTSLLLEVRRQWRVRCTAERQQETLQRAAALRRSLVAAGDVA